ncbi:hypothetical protein Hanom_Chr08g00720921 [Helianthus anomalus]
MYARGPLFIGQWNQQLPLTFCTVQQLVIFFLLFTVLPLFLFGTNRSNAQGIKTPLMPPVTTIEHHLSGHLSPLITTAPCQIVIGHTTTAKSETHSFIYFLTTTQAMVFVSYKGSNRYALTN